MLATTGKTGATAVMHTSPSVRCAQRFGTLSLLPGSRRGRHVLARAETSSGSTSARNATAFFNCRIPCMVTCESTHNPRRPRPPADDGLCLPRLNRNFNDNLDKARVMVFVL
eukprot:m.1011974 g.1011974  ORF g.1011974 m.1011974 type:complete len:112 (+) comp24064_c0_seq11:2307-2642(+)